jgi:D-lyxose ketol-isomerase
MITRAQFEAVRAESAALVRRSGLLVTEAELARMEVADFGLSRIREEGVQIITLFATARLSAKVLVLLPHQTEPEHWHPPVGDDPGKEEHIRAVWGDLRFYIPGPDTLRAGFVPAGKEAVYRQRHEVLLAPGDQLELPPGTPHWFQAGESGAVFYSISTCVRDGLDGFADPAVVRATKMVD